MTDLVASTHLEACACLLALNGHRIPHGMTLPAGDPEEALAVRVDRLVMLTGRTRAQVRKRIKDRVQQALTFLEVEQPA